MKVLDDVVGKERASIAKSPLIFKEYLFRFIGRVRERFLPSLRCAVSIDCCIFCFGINELATFRFSLKGREACLGKATVTAIKANDQLLRSFAPEESGQVTLWMTRTVVLEGGVGTGNALDEPPPCPLQRGIWSSALDDRNGGTG